MPIQLSPGVAVVEKDFTNIVPTIASSACGFAGVYVWGPVMEPTTITTENNLVATFGKPNSLTAQSFFTAANFLSYSSNLLNIRVETAGQKNAVANGPALTDQINNEHGYLTTYVDTINDQDFAAKYPGALGNSLRIAIADSVTYSNYVLAGTASTSLSTKTLTGVDTTFLSVLYVGAVVSNESGLIIGVIDSITSDTVATLVSNAAVLVTTGNIKIDWEFKSLFTSAPGTSAFAISKGATTANDEVHIVILDHLGEWTGVPGSVLEKFAFASKVANAKSENGTNNYYKDVINSRSNYVWWMSHPEDNTWGETLTSTTVCDTLALSYSAIFELGADDFELTANNQIAAFSLLDNSELYQIAYIAAGKVSTTVANFLISNIAEVRKDTIVFISPEDISSGDIIIGSGSNGSTKIISYRNSLPSTSFAVMDTGYKYQYDRYNDRYHYVPLNGDVAGLCARTDATNDPWFSPGGLNRGQVKNVIKLAYNPSQADRDALYTNGVNPVVAFPGQGVVLYGDKTMLAKPSAFDRIGVRRLFIILEKSVAVAAKFQLFEFNDGFTRAQFKNMIEPFLRDIQGRRGINDFQVVCDTTNNTDQVISSNNFIADIYIKPNYSINYITLNFIAGRQAVSFSTLGA